MIWAVLDATWPAARQWTVGDWTLRHAPGGGSRVNAATPRADDGATDFEPAAAAMRQSGQPPLFMIREADTGLDARLQVAGYAIRDPVVIHAAPVATLCAHRLPDGPVTRHWPPAADQTEIWAGGGIGPERLAIMDRVGGPKTSLLGRLRNQPAGCAFVACHHGSAMLHALEVRPAQRRQGVARHLVTAASRWARDQGATDLTLAVTRANLAACALYASLGMGVVGQYHYRIRT